MAASSYATLTKLLQQAVDSHIGAYGENLFECHENSAHLLVTWLDYLRSSQMTGVANELVDGFHATIIEVSACLALGLVRPAVFSLRAQVDVLLAWLFFKDHPIEWEHVEQTGEKYRLASEVLKYLRTFYPRFEDRLKLLRASRSVGDEDPYSMLSAHVHSQNTSTLPPLVEAPAIVQSKKRCDECVKLQNEIAEYLSDVLAACFVDEWADLPHTITHSLSARLAPNMLKNLCQR